MTKKMHAWSLAALPLAIGLASFSGSASAVTFNLGEVRGTFDSELSIGASVSTADAEEDFIHFDTTVDGEDQEGGALARTSDDGRLNYESGDVFSKIFKGTHDLQLQYGDSGAFFRGKYWYDSAVEDDSVNFYTDGIEQDGREPLQKGSGVALLDAFVYHNYTIGDKPGNVRLGRQVVSWGESTFIQNSINSINPVDVAAFRRPGAEIKEGLMPVEMLYFSQGLTDNLTMEAFYQLRWEPFILDNCGTFFAGSDVLAKGCNDRLVVAGPDAPPGDPSLVTPIGARYIVRERKDEDASDDGQFGVAFRYYAAELNDTEFGLYAMNYHSRLPNYANISGTSLGRFLGLGPAFGTGVDGIDGNSGGAGYFFEYPEDIRLYGVSFATQVAGVSLGGEFSYRPNMPIGINSGDMSRTALVSGFTGQDNTHRGISFVPPGTYIKGYDRKEMYQAQITGIYFFERVLGASRLALVGEAGVNYISGIEDGIGVTKYGRDSLFGQSPWGADAPGGALGNNPGECSSQANQTDPKAIENAADWCEDDGFYTSWSTGYRVRASLAYTNVFAGINLTPTFAWSHDVSGYGPNFGEGAKSVGLALNADYANKYNASLSYTNFFGGEYNTNVDRDFASVSVGMNF